MIKRIGSKLYGLYAAIDPLAWQRHYARKTLREKRANVSFAAIDNGTEMQIKKLWGKVDGWHQFYYTIGEKDRAHLYFPDGLFYDKIDRALNDWRKAPIIDDKNLYSLLFHDVRQPKTIGRKTGGLLMDENYNVMDLARLKAQCEAVGGVIIKVPFGSSGGHGIKFWKNLGAETLEEALSGFGNYIVQELVVQHEELSKLHPESLNTVRIMTMTEDDEVKILSSIVRMGIGRSRVDNVSSGGVACGICDDGRLKNFAFDGRGVRYDRHPQGARFEESRVPNFEECREMCKRLAPRVTRFCKLVSWDLAIAEDGHPVLIEANLYGGELDFHQMCNGPIFKDGVTTERMINQYVRRR